ncbi:hypothetical protein CR513_27077, partial [Mucuna pruriens]
MDLGASSNSIVAAVERGSCRHSSSFSLSLELRTWTLNLVGVEKSFTEDPQWAPLFLSKSTQGYVGLLDRGASSHLLKVPFLLDLAGLEREEHWRPPWSKEKLVPTTTEGEKPRSTSYAYYEESSKFTNEGEEDMLQRLLRAVASLQAQSDKQSRLSAEVEQRYAEAEERHRQAKERHLDAMRAAEKREEELRQQIAALKEARERDLEECEENAPNHSGDNHYAEK